MSATTKSFYAACWILAAAGAVVLGSGLRDRVDRTETVSEVKLDNLLASRRGGGARQGDEIPAGDFFYSLTEKLKKEYVEPINDEQKLASGAVRGMIGYLADPKSVFMDKPSFKAFLNARAGRYEGIGADLSLEVPKLGKKKAYRSALQPTPSEESDPREDALTSGDELDAFPRLTVTSVVPGGPADKAGVKAGDVVYSLETHWLLNGDLARRFKTARDAYDAKKIPLSQLNALRKEIKEKYDRMILPLRAKERLTLGTSGAVSVVWERDGQQRSTTIMKAPSERPGIGMHNGALLLPFIPGAPEALKQAIAGKSEITIDLRNNTLGDFQIMRQCLGVLAPAGQYGFLATDRNGKYTVMRVGAEPSKTLASNGPNHGRGQSFAVGQGNSNPPKITLITDRTTRGAAEIFALALSSKGIAKLTGGEMGGDRDVYDIVSLPDGTGYTLVTAHYKPNLATRTAANAKGATK